MIIIVDFFLVCGMHMCTRVCCVNVCGCMNMQILSIPVYSMQRPEESTETFPLPYCPQTGSLTELEALDSVRLAG